MLSKEWKGFKALGKSPAQLTCCEGSPLSGHVCTRSSCRGPVLPWHWLPAHSSSLCAQMPKLYLP